MTEYIKRADSLGLEDTTTMMYKMLTAYRNNDTLLLTEMLQRQQNAVRYYARLFNQLPRLQDMNIDEGYRFVYWKSFCPYMLNVTVSKKDTSVLLHFIISRDTANSPVVNQFDKKLTLKNWERFIDRMDKADFWGLKTDNGIGGLDGDRLSVIGYSHRYLPSGQTSKFNAVSRWGENKENLFGPFCLLLFFSENDKGCIVIKNW